MKIRTFADEKFFLRNDKYKEGSQCFEITHQELIFIVAGISCLRLDISHAIFPACTPLTMGNQLFPHENFTAYDVFFLNKKADTEEGDL